MARSRTRIDASTRTHTQKKNQIQTISNKTA